MKNYFLCKPLPVALLLSTALMSCSPEPTQQNQTVNPPATAPETPQNSGICSITELENPMKAAISEDLCKIFKKHQDDPSHIEHVIITLQKDKDRPDLSTSGIDILSETKNMPLVTAKITAEGLNKLSEMENIARIERDGGMSILED